MNRIVSQKPMSKQGISNGWRWTKLKEVCEFTYGLGLPEKNRINGSIPVFGSNGIIGYHNIPLTQNQTIIIGRKGSIGKVNFSESSCWPIDTTYYIDSSKAKCNLIWLFWTLKWLKLDLLNKATGVPGLNRKDAYNQLIPLPPIDEQKRIAEILEKANALCKKRQEADELSKKIVQSFFLEMFGKSLKWRKLSIKEVCTLINGKAFKPSDWTDNGLKIVRIQNLNDETKPFNYYNGPVEERFFINSGDILISWSGTPGTSFGCFIWNRGKAVLNQHIFKTVIKKDIITEVYFVAAITNILNEMINKAHGGVGLRHITKGDLEAIKIIVPPLSQQQKFVDLVQQFDIMKEKQQESKKEFDNLFNSLMQKYFNN